MTEILFYHLQSHPLERVLPTLVERSIARGWRVVVEAGSRERVEALDALLWTYEADSFLPHGTGEDGSAARHPVVITDGPGRANAADVRFLVDGAALPSEPSAYTRIVILFDGTDDDAMTNARVQWKGARAAGLDCTYWQQNGDGRWEKKA